ncbi:MAG: hypothetical protein GY856_36840 [bacterium]|nr:hypothetical protein [bacterium]
MTETMSIEQLADQIVEITEDLDFVTHGNLCCRLGDAVRGDYEYIHDDANVVFFVGASKEFCDAVTLLRAEKPHRVCLAPCHQLCHFTDGSPLPAKMPWAKRLPAKGYKDPHFASVCFRPASKAGERVG